MRNISIRDKPKAITAEDLIRRYNLDILEKDRKAIRTLNDGLTKTDTIIENFVLNIGNYTSDQADEKITTWFFDGLPTLENSPFKDFEESKYEEHINDLYYDKATGNVYQLNKENDEYSWILIEDETLKESLSIANASADTHDNRRNVFFTEPKTPYSAGDIWCDGIFIKRCRCSRTDQGYHVTDWCLQKDYSDESVLSETRAILNQFKIEVESNYTTFAQLELTKNSIEEKVQGNTTELRKINNEVVSVKESVSSVERTTTAYGTEIKAIRTETENGFKTANESIAQLKLEVDGFSSVIVNKENVISAINQSAEAIKIDANKVNITANDVLNLLAGNAINLTSKNITISSTDFSVDKNGKVTAKAGRIGGFDISDRNITNTTSDCMVYIGNATNNNKDFLFVRTGTEGSYSYPFWVRGDGSLHAVKADIEGKITTTSGTIGGFTISAAKIYGGDASTGVAVMQLPSPNSTWVFAAGGTSHSAYADCPFRVSKKGKLYATDSEISGKITAKTGSFGGWTISTNEIYSETNDFKVTIANGTNSAKDVIVVFNKKDSNNAYPFYLRADGTFGSTKAVIKGSIDATSIACVNGTFAGWNVTSGGLSGNRLNLNSADGAIEIYPSSGGKILFNNGVRVAAARGVVIASNSGGNITAPSNNVDIIACNSAAVYIASQAGANGGAELNTITVANSGVFVNSTAISNGSSRAMKKNIKVLTKNLKEEIYNAVREINLYQYDYKKKYFEGQKDNFGFLIDELEGSILEKLLHIVISKSDKNVKFYNDNDLGRLNLILSKILIEKIEKIERMLS